jgi:ketosteroid isomerase-like protein
MAPTKLQYHFVKSILVFVVFTFSIFTLTACSGGTHVKPDFDSTLQKHFEAISNRDIEAFKSHLTKEDTLYTIVQTGHAFTTPAETIEIHRQWFKDPNWLWEGTVVHKIVGEDVAMALVKYQYRAKPEDAQIATWLTYVFQLQEGQWRIVHDQNTALDFAAFAKMAGIEIK